MKLHYLSLKDKNMCTYLLENMFWHVHRASWRENPELCPKFLPNDLWPSDNKKNTFILTIHLHIPIFLKPFLKKNNKKPNGHNTLTYYYIATGN